MLQISILICTYNRDYILRDCLDSLVAQTADKSLFEVIVINNNSSDKTFEIAEEYASKYNNFRAITEKKQGLSNARNRGYEEAKYDWVSYVDDDAKAYTNYVERALQTIEKYGFDYFGGIYYPWYRGTVRPKWLDVGFGQSIKYSEFVAPLENGYISGGVSVFRKEALKSIGGFPVDLGMNGSTIAYGEETFVQNKLIEKGYSIGFDPELCIDHLVPEYKQKITWHIRSAYAHGRDAVKIFNQREQISFFKFMKRVFKSILKNGLSGVKKIIVDKNYYYQNFILDICIPFAHTLGYYKANDR